ncbi:MAG TPA: hypothetical protein DIT94_08735 [Deltaproteobacteria bacterium]|nr:hypothetical protein [Deltaproteobacteria bacterium]
MIKPERGKMRKSMLSYAFLAVLVGGCATSGDLEELGAELKKNQEALKQELQEKHDESEQKIETAINDLSSKSEQDLNQLRESLKQQESLLGERISTLDESQKQQLGMLRNEIMAGDEAVKTGLQEEMSSGIAALQTQLDNSRQNQEALSASLDALKLQLMELEKLQAEESKLVTAELKAINEALNISRSIQDVQVAFGDLKNRLEDSKTRLSTQELLLRQLDGQVSKSERNNLLIEQDIQELEGKMQDLLKVLEKREKSSESTKIPDTPVKEENSESDPKTETKDAAEG